MKRYVSRRDVIHEGAIYRSVNGFVDVPDNVTLQMEQVIEECNDGPCTDEIAKKGKAKATKE